MSTLTKEQLDSITPETIKAFRVVKRMMSNFGWPTNAPEVDGLAKEAMAAYEYGIRGKRLEKLIEDHLALRGLA